MSGAMPPLPQYVFMAWCLVKHMDNFTFTLPFYLLHNVSGKQNLTETDLYICETWSLGVKD
jgi:hypothetical protein